MDRKISICVVVGLPLCIPATHQLYFLETIPYTRLTFLTFFSDFSHLHFCMYLFVLFHTDCITALSAVECIILIVTQGQ